MMESNQILSITVLGTPAPKGSRHSFALKNKAGVYTGQTVSVESSKRVKPWTEAVKAAALEGWGGQPPITGPVSLQIVYYLRRPKSHYWPVNNRHNGELRDDAPVCHSSTPDMDKLDRATFDALKAAGIYRDDAQVCHRPESEKMYATPPALEGAKIYLCPAVALTVNDLPKPDVWRFALVETGQCPGTK